MQVGGQQGSIRDARAGLRQEVVGRQAAAGDGEAVALVQNCQQMTLAFGVAQPYDDPQQEWRLVLAAAAIARPAQVSK